MFVSTRTLTRALDSEARPPPPDHCRRITAAERSELSSGLNANEEFDRIPDQHGSFTDPNEFLGAREQLVVNINCHPHRILQHQDRA